MAFLMRIGRMDWLIVVQVMVLLERTMAMVKY